MSHPVDVWVPSPPSAVPDGGGNPRGSSTTGGSLHTSLTKTEAPLAPPPHKISPPLSYPLPPSPKASQVIPIFPTTDVSSVPPPSNRCWRTTTFVPSNRTKEPSSAVSHTPRRPSPSVTQSSLQPASVASSPTRADTSLMSGAPDRVPPVGKTCHT